MRHFSQRDPPDINKNENPTTSNANQSNLEEDDEDDYMKMTFTDTPQSTMPETSLQRRQRERREAEARSRPKSKAEIAAEEEARREAALSKSLLSTDPADIKKNKGLSMMAKMGFKGGALGSKDNADARAEPIRINIKDGREGIGLESERKRKLREAAEAAGEAAKKVKLDENEYRERVRLEREEARLAKQLYAVQKIAERMDDEACDDATQGRPTSSLHQEQGGEGDDYAGENTTAPSNKNDKDKKKNKGGTSSRPLKSLPIVYRGIVRAREEKERNRRMRYDLEQSSTIGPLSRLPTYIDEDLDADDKTALGKTDSLEGLSSSTTYVTADDLDEEDEELAAFEALKTTEKLAQVIVYLREHHRYCFWCKFTYPDEAMDGCPGVNEEDHD